MRMESRRFRQAAAAALRDPHLRTALARSREQFIGGRARTVAQLPEFESLREEARLVKDHVLDHLDRYLVRFEEAVIAGGGQVHWARDAEEARAAVLAICRAAGARVVTKGKSMVTEEIGLNPALAAAGLEVVETDLGEYIVQLSGEPPSHIVGPALHKTREQVTELFAARHGTPPHESVAELVAEAREVLRGKFFQADVGITGSNVLVAETGTSLIVTNEGNGDLTQTLPRVHVVVTGIERVVPTLDDAAVFLRLLARSATGQDTENYTTLSTGPRRPDDPDGPREFHVVLVDNGRSRMLGGPFRDLLRCIRCGACLNHCPVYGAVGGHAYGWVYMGPMGAVLTPLMQGLDAARDLPGACTLNGRCETVCPVKIPLAELILRLRRMQHEQGVSSRSKRVALWLWRWVSLHPRWYRLASAAAAHLLSWIRWPRWLPLARAWLRVRDLPRPEGRTFLARVRDEEGRP